MRLLRKGEDNKFSTKQLTFGNDYVNIKTHGAISDRTCFMQSCPIDRPSDRRLKNVKSENTAGLEEVRKLKVFDYNFKKDENKTPRVGVMAQDLEKIFPNAVTKDDDGYLRIRMEDMFYAVVNAVKQLDKLVQEVVEDVQNLLAKVTGLEDRVKVLEEENSQLKKEISEINKRLEKLNP